MKRERPHKAGESTTVVHEEAAGSSNEDLISNSRPEILSGKLVKARTPCIVEGKALSSFVEC